jgi:hypothetical protein
MVLGDGEDRVSYGELSGRVTIKIIYLTQGSRLAILSLLRFSSAHLSHS